MIFLIFTFSGMNAFQVKMSKAEAHKIMMDFIEGKLPPKLHGIENVPGGIEWAVDCDKIQTINTKPIPEEQGYPMQQSYGQQNVPPVWRPQGSGRN